MPPPVFVVCEICGKKFSKRSLGIHQKQCLKKAESSMVSAFVADGSALRLPDCGSLATVRPAFESVRLRLADPLHHLRVASFEGRVLGAC